MKKLPPMQQRFCNEYMRDVNATRAAERAGYKHPHVQGPRLLENVGVKAEIIRLKAEQAERVKIDADWLLVHASEILKADVADIIDPDTGAWLPIHEWPVIWRQMLSGIDVKELFEGYGQDRERIGEVVKVKFIDRIKTMELIGKHIGVQAFKDQVDVNVTGDLVSRIQAGRKRLAERKGGQ